MTVKNLAPPFPLRQSGKLGKAPEEAAFTGMTDQAKALVKAAFVASSSEVSDKFSVSFLCIDCTASERSSQTEGVPRVCPGWPDRFCFRGRRGGCLPVQDAAGCLVAVAGGGGVARN
jgi:hypothetical protein